MYEQNETEAFMHRMAEVRKFSGLSHEEFAKSLNVPQWQILVAEHGVYFSGDQDAKTLLEHMFSGNEFSMMLRRISREYNVPMDWLKHGKGKICLHPKSLPEDEFTVYFPLVISSRSLGSDLQRAIKLMRPYGYAVPEQKAIEQDLIALIMLKYKAYVSCLIQLGKYEFVHAASMHIQDLCNC